MRAVVESPEAMDAVEDAKERWSRVEDAWEHLFWVLSKDPTVGFPLTEGGNVRSFVFDGSWAIEMPTIDVVYEITETKIIIQRARFRSATVTAGRA